MEKNIGDKMVILHENCDPKLADDKSLPSTSYLVTYKVEGKEQYDIAIPGKQVELFDHYYDKYKKDFVTFKQTEGRQNPNLWSQDPPQPAKKRKRRRKPEKEQEE